MRILITGSRDWTDYNAIRDAIWAAALGIRWEDCTLIHGNARGADTMAAEIAGILKMNVETHPARWDIYGRGAGPIRNQEMVDSGAGICLAFIMPGSVGTSDCVKRAEKAGIEVRKYYSEQV
jgi:hypothetical protein